MTDADRQLLNEAQCRLDRRRLGLSRDFVLLRDGLGDAIDHALKGVRVAVVDEDFDRFAPPRRPSRSRSHLHRSAS